MHRKRGPPEVRFYLIFVLFILVGVARLGLFLDLDSDKCGTGNNRFDSFRNGTLRSAP